MFKDERLERLAAVGHNVAQFVSFGPDLQTRYLQIRPQLVRGAINDDETAIDYTQLIALVLLASNAQSVNIRSFHPDSMQGNEFIYGITDTTAVVLHVERLAAKGLYTIVNETIDVNDGGVSGVVQNDFMEFSPGTTPRGVENSADPVCRFRAELGKRILERVYGVDLSVLGKSPGYRIEFSVHPKEVGVNRSRVVIWESCSTDYNLTLQPRYVWPNAFSRLIGDKVFGLLLASELGFPVPAAIVEGRRFHWFLLGHNFSAKTGDVWLRTCPAEPIPGKYPTYRSYKNPLNIQEPRELLESADPEGKTLVSCLIQKSILAAWSGAAVPTKDGLKIEGVAGFGDKYMDGSQAPSEIPVDIQADVYSLYQSLSDTFGIVKIEWAHDSEKVWLLQIHIVEEMPGGKTIYPGEFEEYLLFHPDQGLEYLRWLVTDIPESHGVVVMGNVGMSSHIADVLRKARVPSRLV